MCDSDLIKELNLSTRVQNGLLRSNLCTIGDLKRHIKLYGCTGVGNVGIAGWFSIIQALQPYINTDDTELLLVTSEFTKCNRYCSLLRKGCPVNNECEECELSIVFNKYAAMQAELNQ